MENEKDTIAELNNKLKVKDANIIDARSKLRNLAIDSSMANARLDVSLKQLIGYFDETSLNKDCSCADKNLRTGNFLLERIKTTRDRRKLHEKKWSEINAEIKYLSGESKEKKNIKIKEGRIEKSYIKKHGSR